MTTPSSNKARQYARFIPSEEIGNVAQWQFAEVDEARRLAAVLAVEQAQTAEEPLIDEAALQQARDEAYQLGLEQGRMAGSLEGQQRLDQYIAEQGQRAAQRLDQLAASLANGLANAEQEVAQGVLQLACELARQVIRRELSTGTDALRPVIVEALGVLTHDVRSAVVRLNPSDLASFMAEPLVDSAVPDIKWLADPAVEAGSCLVEAAGTQVDGSLSRRWARALANLGLDEALNPEGNHGAD